MLAVLTNNYIPCHWLALLRLTWISIVGYVRRFVRRFVHCFVHRFVRRRQFFRMWRPISRLSVIGIFGNKCLDAWNEKDKHAELYGLFLYLALDPPFNI